MRLSQKPWAFLALLAIATAALLFSISYYQHRFVRSDADMLKFLPRGDVSIFFANVDALRRAGMLSFLSGSKSTTDTEYQDFMTQTRFDYTQDLDAIAGAADGKQVLLVLRGRFDWSRLRHYASVHGGGCVKAVCEMPTSKPDRWTSFLSIQPDVMGLALSSDRSAVETLRAQRHQSVERLPAQPVWVQVAPSVLKNPVSLPVPLRIFAISLQSADSVVLSLAPAAENSAAAFNLRLEAQCPNPSTADTIRAQMDIQTKMLKLELARERQQASPADLTGLLTSGTFQVIKKQMIGTWPVRKELLSTLE